ncbi:carbohydrate ABC transporter permease [Robinsoniella sp. KNHs210]|uniref:carbohydrate ABC transporter permease n=1 Tax=Robinsoniella sp. KNHs210 TaxID=1469950 RepID=UPI000694CEA5|nr:carbohydrate ABC transporter permease [Robinsoniella sp. KNHs210]
MKHKVKKSQILFTTLGIIIGLFFIFPVIVMLVTSVKPDTEIFSVNLIPSAISFDGYLKIFTEYHFLKNIGNSLFVAVITTMLSLFMQSTSAYAFSRLHFRGKNVMFILVLSTMMIPFSVLMIPLFLVTKSLHLTNSLWGIIIPVAANGYGVYLLRQFFITIPRDLDESAFIDGASHFQIFYKVLLPLCKPILMTLGTSYFIFNWNNYLWPLIVTTSEELRLVQVAIAGFRAERQTLWNLTFAGTVVASVPIFLLFSYFQSYIVDGIKTSGMKG